MTDRMTREELIEAIALEEELARRKRENKLLDYVPYPKQKEFHDLGASVPERALIAGNQSGKTFAASMETAMHATGLYPEWWRGRRWTRPTRGWVAGESGAAMRDAAVRLLLGEEEGTGAIPKKYLLEVKKARGAADTIELAKVKHASGGASTILFKTYEMGREKWQGDTLDYIWFDEEPPAKLYPEGLARISKTRGMVFCTFTPLKGSKGVCLLYENSESEKRQFVRMSLHEALHFTEADIVEIAATYPAHERRARIDGLSMMGEGAVFTVNEELLAEAPMEHVPEFWRVIAAVDFGIGHPFAWVKCALDPETDVWHVLDGFLMKDARMLEHVAAIRARRGLALPTAWPHDGLARDKGSGEPLAAQYKAQGLNMLPERATFVDGSSGVEAGINEMNDRMATARFKVNRLLRDFFIEYLNYHREDGKIVKLRDDFLSAARYALMMKRYARPIMNIERPREKTTMAAGLMMDGMGTGAPADQKKDIPEWVKRARIAQGLT